VSRSRSSLLRVVPAGSLLAHDKQRGPAVRNAKRARLPGTCVHAGEVFRVARRAARLSQDKAAVLFGVDNKTIRRWERGESRLPADALIWIEGLADDHKEAA
jgi:DNA-binding transcriptional regulator YiaG